MINFSLPLPLIIQADDLLALTGTQILAIFISEEGVISSFATGKLQPLLSEPAKETRKPIEEPFSRPDVLSSTTTL